MKLKSFADNLMFNTIQLKNSKEELGTGSFFLLNLKNGQRLILITNKHVIDYNENEEMEFSLHIENNGDISDTNETYNVKYQTHWYLHPSPDIDLCFCFIDDLFQQVFERTSKKVFFRYISEEMVATKDKLEMLSALEKVIMVGYPIGLIGKNNKLPIFRSGYTAFHPALDFDKPNIGIVDMACFPGSSGSPIFLLDENGYVENGCLHLGEQRFLLLGYLYGGPQLTTEGEIIVKSEFSQKVASITKIPTNLGYYVKSLVINDFKALLGE